MSFQIESSGSQASEAAARHLQALLGRSAADWDFRQKLISDPERALTEFVGREFPGSENFRFIENEADATFVLPDAIGEGALDEAQLEAVSGGVFGAIAAGIVLGIAIHDYYCEQH